MVKQRKTWILKSHQALFLTLCLLLILPVSCKSSPPAEDDCFILPSEPDDPVTLITMDDLEGLAEDKQKNIVQAYADLVFCVNSWKTWASSVRKITGCENKEQ